MHLRNHDGSMNKRKRIEDLAEDFDLWKLGRGSAEETHQAEFCAK